MSDAGLSDASREGGEGGIEVKDPIPNGYTFTSPAAGNGTFDVFEDYSQASDSVWRFAVGEFEPGCTVESVGACAIRTCNPDAGTRDGGVPLADPGTITLRNSESPGTFAFEEPAGTQKGGPTIFYGGDQINFTFEGGKGRESRDMTAFSKVVKTPINPIIQLPVGVEPSFSRGAPINLQWVVRGLKASAPSTTVMSVIQGNLEARCVYDTGPYDAIVRAQFPAAVLEKFQPGPATFSYWAQSVELLRESDIDVRLVLRMFAPVGAGQSTDWRFFTSLE